MIPKTPRFSSPKYLAWVRELPYCVCCDEPGTDYDPIVPHHVKGVGHLSGGALKAGDQWVMPMKASHHARWHANPDYEAQWEWVARTAARAIVEIAEGRLDLG